MLRQSSKRLLGFGQTQFESQSLWLIQRYHERVVDHFENPRNVGSLNKDDPNVGTGLVGAPACGDVMRLQIQVDDGTDTITKSAFKGFGCGAAIAASSVVAEWLEGKTIKEALSITNKDIAKHLALPPVKLHCSMLAEDAVRAAVKDYERKVASRSISSEATPSVKATDA